VRENRLHGSEGGAVNARPYPYRPVIDSGNLIDCELCERQENLDKGTL